MATAQTKLTPKTNTAPAVVSIPAKELSGAIWVGRFLGSSSTDTLASPFKEGVNSFIAALKAAGATVSIAATYRPKERAYLMHWCWMLVKKKAKPDAVPSMQGVNINWDHGDEAKSIAAAKAMVSGYGMGSLNTAPALESRHTEKNAIDMNVTWSGTLKIKDAAGKEVEIQTDPRTGMNTDLHAVGKGYGVIKFHQGASDKPHWSTDGR